MSLPRSGELVPVERPILLEGSFETSSKSNLEPMEATTQSIANECFSLLKAEVEGIRESLKTLTLINQYNDTLASEVQILSKVDSSVNLVQLQKNLDVAIKKQNREAKQQAKNTELKLNELIKTQLNSMKSALESRFKELDLEAAPNLKATLNTNFDKLNKLKDPDCTESDLFIRILLIAFREIKFEDETVSNRWRNRLEGITTLRLDYARNLDARKEIHETSEKLSTTVATTQRLAGENLPPLKSEISKTQKKLWTLKFIKIASNKLAKQIAALPQLGTQSPQKEISVSFGEFKSVVEQLDENFKRQKEAVVSDLKSRIDTDLQRMKEILQNNASSFDSKHFSPENLNASYFEQHYPTIKKIITNLNLSTGNEQKELGELFSKCSNDLSAMHDIERTSIDRL